MCDIQVTSGISRHVAQLWQQCQPHMDPLEPAGAAAPAAGHWGGLAPCPRKATMVKGQGQAQGHPLPLAARWDMGSSKGGNGTLQAQLMTSPWKEFP